MKQLTIICLLLSAACNSEQVQHAKTAADIAKELVKECPALTKAALGSDLPPQAKTAIAEVCGQAEKLAALSK